MCNLSLGQFSWGGGSFPWGNHVGDKSSKRQFFSGGISRGIFLGGNYLGGNFPGGSFHRWQFSAGEIISEAIVWGAIIWGDNYSGGNCADTRKKGLSPFHCRRNFIEEMSEKEISL